MFFTPTVTVFVWGLQEVVDCVFVLINSVCVFVLINCLFWNFYMFGYFLRMLAVILVSDPPPPNMSDPKLYFLSTLSAGIWPPLFEWEWIWLLSDLTYFGLASITLFCLNDWILLWLILSLHGVCMHNRCPSVKLKLSYEHLHFMHQQVCLAGQQIFSLWQSHF